MAVRFHRFPLLLTAAAAVGALAACAGPGAPVSRGAAASAPAPVASSAANTLVVPAGEGGGALSTQRTLTVPAGWTARVWARVPGARMEAWTPQGSLLVSVPGAGKVMELAPGPAGTRAPAHAAVRAAVAAGPGLRPPRRPVGAVRRGIGPGRPVPVAGGADR